MPETSQRDEAAEVAELLVESVLKNFLADHIRRRVRDAASIRHVLIEAISLAILLGAAGALLLDIPFRMCFSATLVLVIEALVQVHFAPLQNYYVAWTRLRRNAYLFVTVVVVLRVLVGSALVLPTPQQVAAEIARLGGLVRVVGQESTSNVMLLEMCLDGLLLMLAWRAVVADSRKARRAVVVVAVVGSVLLIFPIDWHAVDLCLLQRGFIGCPSRILFGR